MSRRILPLPEPRLRVTCGAPPAATVLYTVLPFLSTIPGSLAAIRRINVLETKSGTAIRMTSFYHLYSKTRHLA
jgi:hypothetical protein